MSLTKLLYKNGNGNIWTTANIITYHVPEDNYITNLEYLQICNHVCNGGIYDRRHVKRPNKTRFFQENNFMW